MACTGPEHRRVYGTRADTESLNATLERAFYGQRLPSWGPHNQNVTVLLAALAENAWTRHIWHHHHGQPDRHDCDTSPAESKIA